MKTPWHTLAALLATLAAVELSTTTARACGACLCSQLEARLRPQLTREAPTNYRPLLLLPAGTSTDGLSVTDAAGADAAVTLTPVRADGRAVWLAPEDAWQPGADYTVSLDGQVLGTFDTGSVEDLAAPSVQSAELRAGDGGSALCTTVRGGRLALTGVSDSTFYDLLAVVEVSGETLVLEVYGDAAERGYELGDGVDDDTCLGLAQAALPESGPLSASVEVFDMAGNGTRFEGLELASLGDIGAATCPGDPTPVDASDPTPVDASDPPTDADGGSAEPPGAAGSGEAPAPRPGASDGDDAPASAGDGGDGCSAAGGFDGQAPWLAMWLVALFARRRPRRRARGAR